MISLQYFFKVMLQKQELNNIFPAGWFTINLPTISMKITNDYNNKNVSGSNLKMVKSQFLHIYLQQKSSTISSKYHKWSQKDHVFGTFWKALEHHQKIGGDTKMKQTP
jgi:hypothetical protein